MTSNQERDKNPVKQRILDAAAELFMERGFAGTTVREIGERAGVGQSSLYHHARSKGQLLAELHALHAREIMERLEQVLGSREAPIVQLRGVIKSLVAMVHTHRAVVTVYLREGHALSDEARKEVRRERKKVDSIIDRILKQGVDSGEFRPDLDVYLTRRAILGMCNWAYQWYQPSGSRTINEIGEYFADLAESAVCHQPRKSGRNAGRDRT